MKKLLFGIFIIAVGSWIWRRHEESSHIDLSEGCIRDGYWRSVLTQDEDTDGVFIAREGACSSTPPPRRWYQRS
jgi:hypothetical protein